MLTTHAGKSGIQTQQLFHHPSPHHPSILASLSFILTLCNRLFCAVFSCCPPLTLSSPSHQLYLVSWGGCSVSLVSPTAEDVTDAPAWPQWFGYSGTEKKKAFNPINTHGLWIQTLLKNLLNCHLIDTFWASKEHFTTGLTVNSSPFRSWHTSLFAGKYVLTFIK